MQIQSALFWVPAAMLCALASAQAHHSTAPYDLIHGTLLRGVVTRFAWENPHAHVFLDVPGEEGAVEHWTLEAYSPGQLYRLGWSKDTLKPGDSITVMGSRARDGTYKLRLVYVEFPDGRKLMALPDAEK